MSDLIERVARAICEADYWEGRQFERYRGEFMEMAREAIAAMREPTDEMRRAADPDTPHASLEALRMWVAMIDAVLAEK